MVLLIERDRLVDENDMDVPVGEPGEALLKGPLITKGYHMNPEANAAGFTKDGWYRTGDVMQFGKDSNLLYVVGRTKVSLFPQSRFSIPILSSVLQEIINYNGLKVAPAELEAVLCEHSSVADAAVAGVKVHDTEVPRAFVALRPGVEAVSYTHLTLPTNSRV